MQGTRGDLLLAPAVPGDVAMVHVHQNAPWCMQKSAYLASDVSVKVGVKTQVQHARCDEP